MIHMLIDSYHQVFQLLLQPSFYDSSCTGKPMRGRVDEAIVRLERPSRVKKVSNTPDAKERKP